LSENLFCRDAKVERTWMYLKRFEKSFEKVEADEIYIHVAPLQFGIHASRKLSQKTSFSMQA